MDKKWTAKWIGYPGCPKNSAPVFYKSFNIDKLPDLCKIYISGLGAYVLKINGKRVSEDILQPAFSDYTKTVYYNIYEVHNYIKQGENSLEVTLGNVWYNEQQPSDWEFSTAPWKNLPRLILELFKDDELIVRTNSSWKCAESNTVFNSLRCGETFDATKNVSFTQNAVIVPPPMGILKEQKILPIRVSKIYKPQNIITRARYFGSKATQLIYDFGINLSGNAEITVRGKRGNKIILKYFERILENSLPDTASLSAGMHSPADVNRFQTDVYILQGSEKETWHSVFGYNGFRYVQVTGAFDELEIRARCFHTVLKQNGDIKCDNTLITKIHKAIKQSTLTNFHHMPTDCPQREKNGWTADAHLSCEQAYFNFDMTNAYEKWMQDFSDSQSPSGTIPCIVPSSSWGHAFNCGPCWDAALFIIPWQMFRYTGYISHLKNSYEAMRRYISYLPSIIEDGLCSHGLSDWLALVNVGDLSPDEAVITIMCGYIFKLFSRIASLLGYKEDAKEAEKNYTEIKNAYFAKYGELNINSQTIYAMELMLDFTNDRKSTLNKLISAVENADFHITGGVFAAKYLLDALTQNDRFDLAYKIAMQEDFPGWGYLASINSGTLGEDWCGGKSGNHHFLSEIGAWYYKALAGFNIDDNAPGFKHILLAPNIPDDIKNFSAFHYTPFGKLSISWDETEVTIEIPDNTTATFTYKKINQTLTGGNHTFKR